MASKFKGILDRAKDREPETVETQALPVPSPAPLPSLPVKKRGRPSGKRSDAEYVQVTAYIQKDVHRDAKIDLLKSGEDKDFSDLVNDLLADWLKSRT